MSEVSGSTIFLYCCLGYFIFHLLLSDILVLCRLFTRKPDDDLSDIESKTITTICVKLCDIVLKCVMGYFYIFQECWIASTNCLEKVMLAYIAFLDKLVTKMLEYPTCIWTCLSAIGIIVTIAITIIELFK